MNGLRAAFWTVIATMATGTAALAQESEPSFDREHVPTTWEHPAYSSAEEHYMARFEAAGSDSDEDDLPDWSGLWEGARLVSCPPLGWGVSVTAVIRAPEGDFPGRLLPDSCLSD